jgi:hypothetical protein
MSNEISTGPTLERSTDKQVQPKSTENIYLELAELSLKKLTLIAQMEEKVMDYNTLDTKEMRKKKLLHLEMKQLELQVQIVKQSLQHTKMRYWQSVIDTHHNDMNFKCHF